MVNIPKKIIERARAIIIADRKILLINRVKSDESYWVIPGGRVEPGESKKEAVQRECSEELGIKVNVKDLFLKRISDKPETIGHCEYFYLCEIAGGVIGTGQGPEFRPGRDEYKGQYNIRWVDLRKLPDLNLKPEELKNKIVEKYVIN